MGWGGVGANAHFAPATSRFVRLGPNRIVNYCFLTKTLGSRRDTIFLMGGLHSVVSEEWLLSCTPIPYIKFSSRIGLLRHMYN